MVAWLAAAAGVAALAHGWGGGTGAGARDGARPAAGLVACPVGSVDDSVAPPPPVARELRAAWVSPVEGGEWPSRPGMDDRAQQDELRRLLDRAAEVGLNAVVLHVRPAADALYPTERAPWSGYLVGRSGRAPGYDPLAFALDEAHRRGLQLHVWFNPFRAAPPDGAPGSGERALARERPEWVVRYGAQRWIDPGLPEARRAVLDAILEVVDRYDVDAVHLDDYFYPYLEERTVRTRVKRGRRWRTVVSRETIPFPDAASWAAHGEPAGWRTRADWRRDNVSRFVEALYREVKARKPWVLVGISPFGIWRPGHPRGVDGLDAYAEIYADSRRWLREGWVDYLAPQLYWTLDGAQRRFVRLDAWWRAENAHGRHLWPGLFTMRVASRGAPWPAAEIPAQIAHLRDARAGTDESYGHVHFRLATLARARSAALGDRLAAGVYAEPALPPASPWLGAAVPATATVVPECHEGPIRVRKDAALPTPPEADAGPDARNGQPGAPGPVAALRLTAGDTVGVRWWLVRHRAVDGRWRALLVPGTERRIPAWPSGGEPADLVAVAPISATGIEGPPTVVRLR